MAVNDTVSYYDHKEGEREMEEEEGGRGRVGRGKMRGGGKI